MFVHFHDCEDRQCDGCGLRTVIVDVLSRHSERELRFCKNCFRELAATFFHAAAKLRLNIVDKAC
jgi:hypothetical protein